MKTTNLTLICCVTAVVHCCEPASAQNQAKPLRLVWMGWSGAPNKADLAAESIEVMNQIAVFADGILLLVHHPDQRFDAMPWARRATDAAHAAGLKVYAGVAAWPNYPADDCRLTRADVFSPLYYADLLRIAHARQKQLGADGCWIDAEPGSAHNPAVFLKEGKATVQELLRIHDACRRAVELIGPDMRVDLVVPYHPTKLFYGSAFSPLGRLRGTEGMTYGDPHPPAPPEPDLAYGQWVTLKPRPDAMLPADFCTAEYPPDVELVFIYIDDRLLAPTVRDLARTWKQTNADDRNDPGRRGYRGSRRNRHQFK